MFKTGDRVRRKKQHVSVQYWVNKCRENKIDVNKIFIVTYVNKEDIGLAGYEIFPRPDLMELVEHNYIRAVLDYV